MGESPYNVNYMQEGTQPYFDLPPRPLVEQTRFADHGVLPQPEEPTYQAAYQPSYHFHYFNYGRAERPLEYGTQQFSSYPTAKYFENVPKEEASQPLVQKDKPKAPKKPKTGYIIFSAEMRENIKSELEKETHGSYRSQDVIKRTGEIWRKMTADEKIIWQEKANEDRARYEHECEAMGIKPGGRKRSSPRQGPKLAKSSYIIFSSEMRDRIKADLPESSSVQDLIRRTGELWRAMDPSQKEVWEEKARQDKIRYEQECLESGLPRPLQYPNTRPRKDPDAPKRGMSAFLHFSKAMRPKIYERQANLRSADISKLLGEQWKILSDAEKAPFRQQALLDREKYQKEMLAYQTSSPQTFGAQGPETPVPESTEAQWRLQQMQTGQNPFHQQQQEDHATKHSPDQSSSPQTSVAQAPETKVQESTETKWRLQEMQTSPTPLHQQQQEDHATTHPSDQSSRSQTYAAKAPKAIVPESAETQWRLQKIQTGLTPLHQQQQEYHPSTHPPDQSSGLQTYAAKAPEAILPEPTQAQWRLRQQMQTVPTSLHQQQQEDHATRHSAESSPQEITDADNFNQKFDSLEDPKEKQQCQQTFQTEEDVAKTLVEELSQSTEASRKIQEPSGGFEFSGDSIRKKEGTNQDKKQSYALKISDDFYQTKEETHEDSKMGPASTQNRQEIVVGDPEGHGGWQSFKRAGESEEPEQLQLQSPANPQSPYHTRDGEKFDTKGNVTTSSGGLVSET